MKALLTTMNLILLQLTILILLQQMILILIHQMILALIHLVLIIKLETIVSNFFLGIDNTYFLEKNYIFIYNYIEDKA